MISKKKNVNTVIMLIIITAFQLICLFTLIDKAESQYRTDIIITFGVYILVEYAYFIVARVLLKRRAFEIELIAFLLTSIGLSVTSSVYPDKSIKQLIAVLIGIGGFVVLQWLLRSIDRAMLLRVPVAALSLALLAFTLVFAGLTNGAKNWLYIGGLSIQPSELVKVAFIFVGAATLEKLQSNKSLTKYIIFASAASARCF